MSRGEAATDYDVIILDGGPAGEHCASHLAEAGQRVAIERELLGGECCYYSAVPRVVFSDPQAAAVGEADGRFAATVQLSNVARTATYTRGYDSEPGFLTLLSDGERLTGAYALGPEAGEWLQQAALAIRAKVPLEVLNDVIQPFPTFSEAFLHTPLDLRVQIAAGATTEATP